MESRLDNHNVFKKNLVHEKINFGYVYELRLKCDQNPKGGTIHQSPSPGIRHCLHEIYTL